MVKFERNYTWSWISKTGISSWSDRIRLEAKSTSFFKHLLPNTAKSFFCIVVCAVWKNDLFYRKVCSIFFTIQFLPVFSLLKWKIKTGETTLVDGTFSLTRFELILHNVINRSNEDVLLYKNLCLFLVHLVFYNFQGITVSGRHKLFLPTAALRLVFLDQCQIR